MLKRKKNYINSVRVLFVFSASAILLAPPAPTMFFCILYMTELFLITMMIQERNREKGRKKSAHFRVTSLRLHCSTSARASAPASSMPLLCKLARVLVLNLAIAGKYSKEITCAHLSDTRAWFIFRASARNFAPLEPMLLFRRLNHKYVVIKHSLTGAT